MKYMGMVEEIHRLKTENEALKKENEELKKAEKPEPPKPPKGKYRTEVVAPEGD